MTKPTTPRPPKQPVLVILHSDGYVQVYGDRKLVDCHVAIMPQMTSDKGQMLAEQILELELPLRYKQIYWPGNLIGTHQVRTRTLDDIAQTEWELQFCRVLSAIGQDARAEVVEWVA